MNWHRHRGRQLVTSDCGRYEIAGRYDNGAFAWRGRAVDTDHLVCSSADQTLVKLNCARHAARIDLEAGA